jgi:cytochrome c oxidase assembly protein subunit 15
MNQPMRARTSATSRWPQRLALSALAAAVPLVFFGGSVTTLHAGLAIDGWLVLEPGRGDHFLWLYPVDKWFRDLGTFVEHTHRLLGSLVGLLAIATVVTTWATDRRRLPRILSLAALLAVIVQGTIGGFRVLERSDNLAFLHGAIAQGVFALLGASWIALSPALPAERRAAAALDRRLRRLSTAAVASVYLQIVAGAWLRHGGGIGALAVHLAGVVAVLILVPLLVRRLREGGDRASAEERTRLRPLRRWLLGALAGQMALGVATLVVVSMPAAARAGEGLGTAALPTLHVVGGGILLLACVASSMWAHRVFPSRADRAIEAGPALGLDGRERWEAAR